MNQYRVEFRVKTEPVAQPRHRFRVVSKIVGTRGKRVQIPVPYLDDSHPVHTYKAAVLLQARLAMPRDWHATGFELPLACIVHFFLTPEKDNPQDVSLPHAGKPDIDNLVKSTFDALKGFVFADDSQVCELVARKFWCGPEDTPGVDCEFMSFQF